MTPRPRLIVFSDLGVAPESLWLERVERTARAAAPDMLLVILRDKDLAASRRLELGRALRERARRHGQLFGVAERLDLALLLGADAVHLGEDSVETSAARTLVGGRTFVSRACHDPDRAAEIDADAIVLSPILAARKARPAHGLSALGRARERLGRRLLYALGGVTADTAAACLGAGADGVAVISAVIENDPESLIAALGLQRTDSNHS